MLDNQPAIEMRNITKRFVDVLASDHVNLSLYPKEVVALLGENGAGKTTLMNILFGYYQYDEGDIFVHGKKVSFSTPKDAIAAGIAMIHQHFTLVPTQTVLENVIIGVEGGFFLNLGRAKKKLLEIEKRFGLNLDPDAIVSSLSIGKKQKLEILKALYRDAEILIMDEPTAVLTPQETDELFVELKELRNKGQTIIFISHKLGEVFRLCDRVTVMRDGAMIATHDVADVDRQTISNEMVGREVRLSFDKEPASPGEPALKARNLSYVDDFGITMVDRVSFSLRKGEILGVVGVDGNGQSELVRILTGSAKTLTGSVHKGDQDLTNAAPRRIRKAGVAHVAEDRMTTGTALPASIADNLLADRYADPTYTGRGGFLKRQAMAQTATDIVRRFDIRCSSPNQSVASLSGGNMQKVVIGREFTATADVLIVSQPTRGVDIGAIEFIHSTIMAMRDAGKAVLLVSSDLGEIMSLSDSLIVMHAGRIVAYFPSAAAVTDTELGLYMLGLKSQDETEIRMVLHE
ncbi:MAG: hypothetical protein A2Z99_12270 [Treponema sp. GWB1_62_6]|nr:MAG: hypothetical protein A2Z99_12270 [Treponema sp. GWB1_62_6]